MYKITFTAEAYKDLKKINKEDQARIQDKLLMFSSLDNLNSFAKKLHNFKYGDYRFRVGSYRIIFNLIKNEIVITAVDHRKDIYK